MENEWVRRDTGDFHQGRDDDMEKEAEREERRGMEDPEFLPEPRPRGETPEGGGGERICWYFRSSLPPRALPSPYFSVILNT